MQPNHIIPVFILTSFPSESLSWMPPKPPPYSRGNPTATKSVYFLNFSGMLSSWITFASLLRSLTETPVAVGSSSAVLSSTSHELTVDILVMDPSISSVGEPSALFKSKILNPKDYGWQTLIWKDLGQVKVLKVSQAWNTQCQCHRGNAKPVQALVPNPSMVGHCGMSQASKHTGHHGVTLTPQSEMNWGHTHGLSPLGVQEGAFPFPQNPLRRWIPESTSPPVSHKT